MGNMPASLVSHTVCASPVKVTLDDADTGAADSFVGEAAAGGCGGVLVERFVCWLSIALGAVLFDFTAGFFRVGFLTVLLVSTTASASGTSA